jgi:uncharacterized protein YhfF
VSELTITEFAPAGPQRDRIVRAVLCGAKTTAAGLLAEYAVRNAQLPQAGLRELVVDSAGQGAALIETTRVQVLPLSEVDLAFVASEVGEFRTPAQWRAAREREWHSARYRAMLGDPDFTVRDDTMLVTRQFRLLRTLLSATA